MRYLAGLPEVRSCVLRERRYVLFFCTACILAGCDKKIPVAPDDASSLSLSTTASQSSYDLTAGASGFTAISPSWRDISPNETGYEIHRSANGVGGTFSLLTPTAANVTSASALAAEFASRGVEFIQEVSDTEDGLLGFEVEDTDGYILFFGKPR